MSHTRKTMLAAVLAVAVALLGADAALATAGGAAPTSSSSPASGATPGTTQTTFVATPVPPVVVSPGPVTMRMRSTATLGRTVNLHGTSRARDAGHAVQIQVYDSSQAAWVAATSTVADGSGAFLARWRTSLLGRIQVRAVVASGSTASHKVALAASADSSLPAQITVYRGAIATYFGPGFFGQQTACGQILTHELVGVANRTLPCGTLVEVDYGGRTLTVPVVDRGPYANGADWDLTSGAAAALGATETVHIGTIIVGRAANTASLGEPVSPPADPATGGVEAG